MFEFLPVTAGRSTDLDRFAQRHGAFHYCSCMRWRLTSTEFRASTKESRAEGLAALVRAGAPVGVLAYADGEPVGWCSIAPRTGYAALERSRVLARVDDASVWSVVCFFVDSAVRRRGLSLGLLRAAVDYAAEAGAGIVEGYPVEPGPRSYTWMGSPATFLAAGFQDVTPPGRRRTVMRRNLRP